MNHYAQINAMAVCVGLLETPGTIDAPHMIAIDPGAVNLGQRWTGTAWENVAPTAAELAAQELANIDATTGMSRTMREAFIAIADKVAADVTYLKAQEAKAAIARGKLKG
jgi:hypothetical protein